VSARRRLPEDRIEAFAKERPYVLEVLQTQILYDIAGMLDDVGKLLAKPMGYTHPIKVTVSELTIIDFVNGAPYSPLFSITIFNDGPDEVYPSVNTYQKLTSLKYGESLTIEFHTSRIERLYLDVDEGKKANIRGFGMY
jgi:hypothetical protein